MPRGSASPGGPAGLALLTPPGWLGNSAMPIRAARAVSCADFPTKVKVKVNVKSAVTIPN